MLPRGLESLIPKKNDQNFGSSQGPFVDDSKSNTDGYSKQQDQNLESTGFKEAQDLPRSLERETGDYNNYREIIKEKEYINQEKYNLPLSKKEKFSQNSPESKDSVYLIEIDKIKPNPYQPRRYFDRQELEELAASIKEYGLLQPLIVTKVEKQTEYGQEVNYQLIAGERRFLASKLVGLERVPAIIKELKEEKEKLEMAIIENLQRQNLNPIESARAFARLTDEFKLSQREVAIKLGKSREAVANTLRLLQLSKEAQEALENGKITESHARIILSFNNYEHQNRLLEEIIKYELSVRETQERAKNIARSIISTDYLEEKVRKKREKQKREIDPFVLETERFLEEFFSTPVEISQRGREGGKINIRFFDNEHLKGLIEKMTQKNNEFLD